MLCHQGVQVDGAHGALDRLGAAAAQVAAVPVLGSRGPDGTLGLFGALEPQGGLVLRDAELLPL